MVATTVCLTQNVRRERPLPTESCDWESVEVMGYVCWDGFLDSRRFGALLVEDQAMRITVDEKSRTSAYVA